MAGLCVVLRTQLSNVYARQSVIQEDFSQLVAEYCQDFKEFCNTYMWELSCRPLVEKISLYSSKSSIFAKLRCKSHFWFERSRLRVLERYQLKNLNLVNLFIK